ncbi:7-carboxy-7-deazaguanine synthase QueE [Terrihabitans sp. B22-R8]|uniref:7-carboxy-7-deazaguanine synthase QueE n=1 Tax=Terrihabitans sp. B22-R8 TaxID=3425128 RepID=UPI00403D22C0
MNDGRSDARIRVAEIFGPTIQGEGPLIGLPTVFVRTGGCDYRCSWCDSLHAVDAEYRHEWTPMSTDAVWDKVRALSVDTPLMVSLSGGNPAIQPLGDLMALGKPRGYRFALETQGSLARDWFRELDVLVLSPKPPSSGMETDWAALDACIASAGAGPQIALKIVVFDDADYAFARRVSARHGGLALYLQPGNHTPPPAAAKDAPIDIEGVMDRMRWLIDKIAADAWFTPRILPQLHVLIWGNRRGV